MLEKLVLRRINREFIEYMRVTYKNVSKDHALFRLQLNSMEFGIPGIPRILMQLLRPSKKKKGGEE